METIKSKKKIRVLIVDDSFFMRRLLGEILNSDSDIEVVGEAKDGASAINEALKLKPDVITMDYNMPKMNGAKTTKKILSSLKPLPGIIMVSAYAKRGAEETLEALRAGAVDFILKPSGEVSLDIDRIKSEIINRVKIAAQAHVQKYYKALKPKLKKEESKIKGITKVVIIGASTGGPPLLEDIIATIPDGFSSTILVVQHMPGKFTKIFADRLNKISKIAVNEAKEGDAIKGNTVLIAPGGFHMKIKENGDKKNVHLTKDPPKNGLRPAIDVLMSSAAQIYTSQLVGIILTGMGSDGLEGIQDIKKVGGYAIVQDPKTTVVSSMPKVVIEKGLADEVLKPQEIVKRIIELGK